MWRLLLHINNLFVTFMWQKSTFMRFFLNKTIQIESK